MGHKDIGQFLRHIWVSKYGDLKNKDLFTALKEHIENKGIRSIDFARTCCEECEKYIHLITANDAELGNAAPLVKTLVDELGFDVTLPLLLSAHTHLTNAELEKVVRWILVFVTRYTILLGLDPSGLESTMFSLAREVRTHPKATRLAKIKSTLVKKSPNKRQLETIKVDGDGLIFEPQDAVYLLTRLANHMQSKTKEVSLDESNLEHIFPKHPSADWTNKEEMEPYLWHLGNLTMLGTRLNGKVANSGFTKKRHYYEKNTELEITKQVAATNTVWNRSTVLKRAENLLPLIIEIWDFDNPSRV